MRKKLFLLASFAGLALNACTHKSEIKTETGVVVEKQFSPSFDGKGSGMGYSTSGDLVVTNNNVHKAEQFVLVFKCEHNTLFTVDRKELYLTLEKGDTVTIQYREVLNSDNEVKDLDFVTATKH